MRNKSTPRRGGQVPRNLSDGPAYAGQQKTILKLECAAILLSTTVTTGIIASAQVVQAAQIVNFAARFASTFDEYRILGAKFRITPVSSTSGVSKMWFDEKSGSNPTSNEAQERTCAVLSNTNAADKSRTTMAWNARDLLDLQYTSTGTTTSNPVTFKIYTDTATFGAPIVATPTWLIEPVLRVEFRGIKSS